MDAPEQYLHHPMNILSLGGHAQNLRTCSAIIVAAIASVTRQLDECLLRQKRSFAQICETTRKLGNSAKAFPSERVGPATTWLSRECIHSKSVNLPNKNDRAPTKFIVNNLSTVKDVRLIAISLWNKGSEETRGFQSCQSTVTQWVMWLGGKLLLQTHKNHGDTGGVY